MPNIRFDIERMCILDCACKSIINKQLPIYTLKIISDDVYKLERSDRQKRKIKSECYFNVNEEDIITKGASKSKFSNRRNLNCRQTYTSFRMKQAMRINGS